MTEKERVIAFIVSIEGWYGWKADNVMVFTKPIDFHVNVKFPAVVRILSSVVSLCLKLDDVTGGEIATLVL